MKMNISLIMLALACFMLTMCIDYVCNVKKTIFTTQQQTFLSQKQADIPVTITFNAVSYEYGLCNQNIMTILHSAVSSISQLSLYIKMMLLLKNSDDVRLQGHVYAKAKLLEYRNLFPYAVFFQCQSCVIYVCILYHYT